MEEKRIVSIAEGVEGLFIENRRFNTTLVSFNFYLPLSINDISANVLLTYVLSTCSGEYGSFREMNLKLNMLYGADVAVSAAPVGDCQVLRFVITTVNDSLVPDGSPVIRSACDYIMSLIFSPRVANNAFTNEDIAREKRKLLEDIEAELNDKRSFARKRLKEEMFETDPFGQGKLGTAEATREITPQRLYSAWQDMLANAFVRVQVIGAELPDGLFNRIGTKFAGIRRSPSISFKNVKPVCERDKVKYVTDRMEIIQGKLVMGFSSRQFGNDETSLPLMIAVDIFGGGPYSRLFSVVREKMSLCYYCSASSVRLKGFVMVDSGLEAENADRAVTEIINQLSYVQAGKFSDFEYESSLRSVADSLRSYDDSLTALDVWYAQKIHNTDILSPSDVARRVSGISREDVKNAAAGIKLNTVYLLLPEENK